MAGGHPRQEYNGGTTEESDVDMVGEIEQLDDAEFSWRLAEMAVKEDDEGSDWLPEWLHQHRKQTMKHRHESLPFSGWPKTYVKGLDVMSKSECTQYQYKKQWKGQTQLSSFGFARNNTQLAATTAAKSTTPESSCHMSEVEMDTNLKPAGKVVDDGMSDREDSGAEDWEELEVMMKPGNGTPTCNWGELHDQIKADLKKHSNTLPLSQVHQLLILSNFATLWLKGLPHEKRGGERNACLYLHDESMQSHCCAWLSNLPARKVTPQGLQSAVHTTIFPELGITPKHPISEWTACQWLIKLGWHQTRIQKGVYMDGHEHEDVVKYQTDIFLPWMIIAYFHDECSHANDESNSAWQCQNEQVLHKKGQGHVIHVSDFITSEDPGRLASPDGEDAWRIIYPGANGDAWWTHINLLEQIKATIQIHEKVHGPECVALFIFDNSSAHTLLTPDALHTFDMNKGDGGKQWKQCDTKMITPGGEPWGLQSILEECGFNIQGLQTQCSPTNFKTAKKTAVEILNSCPTDVICCFINCSYQFMSAYWLGLTGRAAEWAVWKQKQHCQVSQSAMMAIKSILH
ncbi:hypothetical protein PISMIDRAFT_31034 [Pisolithus microcarpus 441]|uniref:DDE-1 domain-containing protein n=1 Tax=Pisolithus microcarpus 441 TaxID=765257 RepID=A0A0C9XS62_9AGAM|nr:hypothetical protein PISMIDRAFT_31034 [Pisolithus microcarpus 441]